MVGLLSRRKSRGLLGDNSWQDTELPPLPGPISGFGGGTFNMDGSVATPNTRLEGDMQPIDPVQSAKPKKKGILSGFFGSDFSDRAARAAAIIDGDWGAAANITENARNHMRETQRMQSTGQALAGMNITPEQRRILANNPDLAERYILKSMEPQGPEYGYTQDNAGNMWQYDKRTGKFADQPSFIDRAPKQYLQDGQVINVPNPFNQPRAPKVGDVEDGYVFQGGDPNNPASWAPAQGGGIPSGNPLGEAPKLNAQQGGQMLGNAFSQKTITPQQAQTVRQSLGPNGQAKFEQWLRENNIQIGGF